MGGARHNKIGLNQSIRRSFTSKRMIDGSGFVESEMKKPKIGTPEANELWQAAGELRYNKLL